MRGKTRRELDSEVGSPITFFEMWAPYPNGLFPYPEMSPFRRTHKGSRVVRDIAMYLGVYPCWKRFSLTASGANQATDAALAFRRRNLFAFSRRLTRAAISSRVG